MDNQQKFNKVAVVIPAYEPGEKLLGLLAELRVFGFGKIVVVNDGSSPDKDGIFAEVAKQAILLRHEKNMGKGWALKTAFSYVLNNFPEAVSVVTVDADGQHLSVDVNSLALLAMGKPASLCLGVRAFSGKVPLRSRLGNSLTKIFFNTLTNKYIQDTQTGLRAIPVSFIPELLQTKSSGYEFEMEMIHLAVKNKISIEQMPISTVYVGKNKSSHFKPIRDSIKVYGVLFKYSAVAMSCALGDYFLFILFFSLLNNVLYANYSARVLTWLIYFTLMKKFVFSSQEKANRSFPKFLLLAGLNPLAAAALIEFFLRAFLIPVPIGKIMAETTMFFFNFLIQKKYVFR